MLSGNKPLVCSRVGSVVTARAGFQYRLVRAFWVCVWRRLLQPVSLDWSMPHRSSLPQPESHQSDWGQGRLLQPSATHTPQCLLTGWETHQNGKMVCVGLNAENSSTEFWQEGVLFDQNKYKNRYWRTKKRKIKTLWTWMIEFQHKSGLFGS